MSNHERQKIGRVRRSELSTPGHSDKMIAKAAASDDDDEEETEADEEDEETSAEPTVHEGHDTFCYHDDDDSACNRSLLRRQAR